MKKLGMLSELEKLEDLIQFLGLLIKDLELENRRLRRKLQELQAQQLELMIPNLRNGIEM